MGTAHFHCQPMRRPSQIDVTFDLCVNSVSYEWMVAGFFSSGQWDGEGSLMLGHVLITAPLSECHWRQVTASCRDNEGDGDGVFLILLPLLFDEYRFFLVFEAQMEPINVHNYPAGLTSLYLFILCRGGDSLKGTVQHFGDLPHSLPVSYEGNPMARSLMSPLKVFQ